MEYRWLEPSEIDEWVNPVLRQKGWALLNCNEEQPTCRVLGAFDDIMLVGFNVLQLTPMVGPLYVSPDHRDGSVSRELVQEMHAWLGQVGARGYMAVCDSPVSERMCQRYGMTALASPVYVTAGV